MSGRDRRPPPRRRPAPTKKGGGTWILLLAGIAALGAFAAFRNRSPDKPPVRTATEAPPVAFTIPEGLRREDIAAKLTAETRLSGAEYLRQTAESDRGRSFAGTSGVRSLEGFLFPATYQIGSKTTVADLIQSQLNAYAANTRKVRYVAARAKNLTPYEVLIIASMIEREARIAADRPLIASVIYNRLRAQMRLDIDATTQYAVGSWKTNLTVSDLNNPSPYNTRKARGLPPGPIANPGLASIEAAAHPAKSNYLFYVAKGDGSGGSYFAATDADFQAAVAKAKANAGG